MAMTSKPAPTPQQLQSWLQQAQAIRGAQRTLWQEMEPFVNPLEPADPVLLAAYSVCGSTAHAVSWLKAAINVKGE